MLLGWLWRETCRYFLKFRHNEPPKTNSESFLFPAVWFGLPRRDPTECNKECHPQWPFHCPHCRSGSYPRLSLLHCGLYLLQRRFHFGCRQDTQQNTRYDEHYLLDMNIDYCNYSSKNGSCVLHFLEHVASLVGEFFSGGVCHKENGENCSSESMRDGRLIHGNDGFGWFLQDWIHLFLQFRFFFRFCLRDCSYIHLPVEVLEVHSPEESQPTEL